MLQQGNRYIMVLSSYRASTKACFEVNETHILHVFKEQHIKCANGNTIELITIFKKTKYFTCNRTLSIKNTQDPQTQFRRPDGYEIKHLLYLWGKKLIHALSSDKERQALQLLCFRIYFVTNPKITSHQTTSKHQAHTIPWTQRSKHLKTDTIIMLEIDRENSFQRSIAQCVKYSLTILLHTVWPSKEQLLRETTMWPLYIYNIYILFFTYTW